MLENSSFRIVRKVLEFPEAQININKNKTEIPTFKHNFRIKMYAPGLN